MCIVCKVDELIIIDVPQKNKGEELDEIHTLIIRKCELLTKNG